MLAFPAVFPILLYGRQWVFSLDFGFRQTQREYLGSGSREFWRTVPFCIRTLKPSPVIWQPASEEGYGLRYLAFTVLIVRIHCRQGTRRKLWGYQFHISSVMLLSTVFSPNRHVPIQASDPQPQKTDGREGEEFASRQGNSSGRWNNVLSSEGNWRIWRSRIWFCCKGQQHPSTIATPAMMPDPQAAVSRVNFQQDHYAFIYFAGWLSDTKLVKKKQELPSGGKSHSLKLWRKCCKRKRKRELETAPNSTRHQGNFITDLNAGIQNLISSLTNILTSERL